MASNKTHTSFSIKRMASQPQKERNATKKQAAKYLDSYINNSRISWRNYRFPVGSHNLQEDLIILFIHIGFITFWMSCIFHRISCWIWLTTRSNPTLNPLKSTAMLHIAAICLSCFGTWNETIITSCWTRSVGFQDHPLTMWHTKWHVFIWARTRNKIVTTNSEGTNCKCNFIPKQHLLVVSSIHWETTNKNMETNHLQQNDTAACGKAPTDFNTPLKRRGAWPEGTKARML